MRLHSEVNFEKRGRLNDHQTCPVCGACRCDKHTHYLLLTLLIIALFFLVSATPIQAQSIVYTFTVPDLPARQFPFPNSVFFDDIDDDGTVLANTDVGNIHKVALIDPKHNRRTVIFDCDGASYAINKGSVVGWCPEYGAFVRTKQGQIIQLPELGVLTLPFGLARDGNQTLVAGQYFDDDFNEHGFFCRFPVMTCRTIDYIDPRPGTIVSSYLMAPVSDGRIIGHFDVFGSNFHEEGYFIYDNGQFDISLIPNRFTTVIRDAVDMNELGQVIIQQSSIVDNSALDPQIYDDGRIYTITGKPPEAHYLDITGMNKNADFTGSYWVQDGVDETGAPTYRHYNFVATQAPVKLAKGNK